MANFLPKNGLFLQKTIYFLIIFNNHGTHTPQCGLNMALGWLAREGKVSFREEEKDFFVALV